MRDVKLKVFRDPLYDYIQIREDYCKDFIDTAVFQRLRRIEQTSMRILYPSAHHDRFAHSIGVFYLGQMAFTHIEANSKSFFTEITDDQWESYKRTFEIACLLHDCGHSPFSHTFEHHYLHQREPLIKKRLTSFFTDEPNFGDDYDEASPAPHEKISALLLLQIFGDIIAKKYAAQPKLAERMIMGCRYENPSTQIQKFENKLISMLNGSGIDVDSLDYIQRDSWISGVSNVEIDYQRLLSSLQIRPDEHGIPQIVFKKSALSVLDNISIGRNFLYKWIYSHHIVNYEQYLLKEIVKDINTDTGGELVNSIFTIDSFIEPTKFLMNIHYLPSDDDLMYIIKSFYGKSPKIEELLSRKYRYKALWKTYFEFNEVYFSKVTSDNRMKISGRINDGKLNDIYGRENLLCIDANPKLKSIRCNDFFINIDEELIDAAKATTLPSQNLDYFILYVSPDLTSRKEEIIQKILQLQS